MFTTYLRSDASDVRAVKRPVRFGAANNIGERSIAVKFSRCRPVSVAAATRLRTRILHPVALTSKALVVALTMSMKSESAMLCIRVLSNIARTVASCPTTRATGGFRGGKGVGDGHAWMIR